MIKPTNFRMLHYTPSAGDLAEGMEWHDRRQKLAAQVVHVWGDRMVNLSVLDSDGNQWKRHSVPLLQDDDAPLANGGFCEWVDYQKGQAAKVEQLERQNKELADKAMPPAA